MNDQEFKDYLEGANGYLCVRKLSDGAWVGISRLFYTWGLCVNLDKHGYDRRYCYDDLSLAMSEIEALKNSKEEPKGWIARRPQLK